MKSTNLPKTPLSFCCALWMQPTGTQGKGESCTSPASTWVRLVSGSLGPVISFPVEILRFHFGQVDSLVLIKCKCIDRLKGDSVALTHMSPPSRTKSRISCRNSDGQTSN